MARQILGKVMITNKGEFNSSSTYNILDVVSYNGSSYLSKINNNRSTPTSDSWQLVAKKGDAYEVTEEDLKEIEDEIVNNANSKFNENVREKTSAFNSNSEEKTATFNSNVTSKTNAFNSNATEKTENFNSNVGDIFKNFDDNATTKLDDYNTNATTKLSEYNQNASNKISNLNTNFNEKTTSFNNNAERKNQELDDHAEQIIGIAIDTRNELNRVKDDILETGEDTDTFIHVEDSTMAELQELNVDGVCEQETTTGNQLIQLSERIYTSNGVKYEINNYGIKVNGTATNDTLLIPLGNYSNTTPLFTLEPGDYSMRGYFRIAMYDGSNRTFFGPSYDNVLNFTLTENFNVSYIQLYIPEKSATLTNGSSIDNYYEIQLVKGTYTNETIPKIEPYTGGQQSPNPDFPQEIKTIENKLNITSCNSNLFDYKNVIIKENSYFSIDGIEHTNAEYKSTDYIKVCGKSFTLSRPSTKGFSIAMIAYDAEKKYITGVTLNQKKIITISSEKVIHYIRFSLGKIEDDIKQVKLEFGEKSTPYEEHLSSQITANLPDGEFIGKIDDTYKDTLSVKYNEEDGEYHLVLNKVIKKHIYGSTRKWTRVSAGNKGYRFINSDLTKNIITPASDNNKSIILSDKFITTSILKTTSGNDWGIATAQSGNVVIYYEPFSQYTDTMFNEFVANNPFVVYYPLAEPYEIDLGIVDMPLSYNNVTNIFTDSDLLPNINAKYYRNFTKTVQNLQVNEKALKQELVDINNRLSALETSRTSLMSESEEENDIQEQ